MPVGLTTWSFPVIQKTTHGNQGRSGIQYNLSNGKQGITINKAIQWTKQFNNKYLDLGHKGSIELVLTGSWGRVSRKQPLSRQLTFQRVDFHYENMVPIGENIWSEPNIPFISGVSIFIVYN